MVGGPFRHAPIQLSVQLPWVLRVNFPNLPTSATSVRKAARQPPLGPWVHRVAVIRSKGAQQAKGRCGEGDRRLRRRAAPGEREPLRAATSDLFDARLRPLF